MPAIAIKTPFGADLKRVIAVYGADCDPDEDLALFVVRDKHEKVFYWTLIQPEFNEVLNTWTFTIYIPHLQAEQIPKGSYKYGLTLYRHAEFEKQFGPGDFGFDLGPVVNGEPVIVIVNRKPYVVQEAVAREEGIRGR